MRTLVFTQGKKKVSKVPRGPHYVRPICYLGKKSFAGELRHIAGGHAGHKKGSHKGYSKVSVKK